MPGWEQLGMQAASQGLSGAMGLILGNVYDRRQLNQQSKLQQLQIKGNKELTDYNFMKQMEMWRNTNYPAQMAMLKAAGLNPALMYEGGGQGGSTNISTGNVTGGNAPTGGGEVQAMMAMGLTRQLQQAQIENIKAQTAKTQAETPNVVETGKGISLDNARKEIENSIASIEEHVAGKTQNQRIAMYEQETEASMKRLELLRNETSVNKDRLNAEIGNLIGDMMNKAVDIESKKQNIQLSKAQIKQIDATIWKISEEIAQEWEKIGIQDFEATTSRLRQQFDSSGLPKSAVELLNSVTTAIIGGAIMKGATQGTRSTIPGFQIPKK